MYKATDTNSHVNVDYSKLFNEIEIMCKRNLCTLRDIIKDYDVKKEGKISRFKFEKVFNSISVYVARPILDQVIIEYTVFVDVEKRIRNKETGEISKMTQTVPFEDFNGVTYVDTERFLTDYEEYLNTKNSSSKFSQSLSKNNSIQSQTAKSATLSSVQTTKIEDENPTINDLVRFGNSLKFQNTSIKEVMEPFDKHHIGHVPANKFFNGFGMNNLTKKIANAYKRPPTNDVYYLELQKDIDKASNDTSITKSSSMDINSFSQSKTDDGENFTYNGQPMPDFFSDFCQQLRIKGIDPYLTLSVYDKHKKHSILPCHFLASFVNFDPKFSTPQIQLLKDLFLNQENKFDYMSFCEAVDCENAKYERESAKLSAKHSQSIKGQRTFDDESMKKDINEVLQRIKERIEIRHALLGDLIESKDQQKTGKIRANLFFKILEQERYDLDIGDQKAIIDEFSDPTGQFILYKPFIISVTPQRRQNSDVTAQSVLDRLKDYLNNSKISIKPLLLRLDNYHCGAVNFKQLLAVFSSISFDLNNQERRNLLAKVTDRVDIDRLCDEVDYKAPQNIKSVNDKDESEEDEEEDEEVPTKEVLDALARLYSIVLAEENKIDILDEFQKFGQSVDGLMNESKFKSSLINIPSIERIKEKDAAVLASYYSSKKGKGMVSMKKFIGDLTKYGDDQLKMEPSLSLYPSKRGAQFSPSQQQQQQKSQRFMNSTKNQTSDGVFSAFTYSSPLIKGKSQSTRANVTTNNSSEINNNSFDLSAANSNGPELNDVASAMIRRLKVYLDKKELNANSLFAMYDTSRNGYVPKDRVPKILSSIYFEFNDNEIQQNLNFFQSQRMKNCFNYKRFINVLENIKTSTVDKKSVKVKAMDEDPLNHPQNYELASLINTLHSKLSERHKKAEFVFAGVKSRTVSADDFRERISDYGLVISNVHVQMLLENYRANLNNDVDWRRFCNDVNSIRTVEPPRC